MTRREAREFMMKVLYQMDVTSDDMTSGTICPGYPPRRPEGIL